MAFLGFPPQHYSNPNPPPNPWNQGIVPQPPLDLPSPAEANAQQVVGPATLVVRHLPEAIPIDTLSRLFSHYGASAVRHGTAPRARNCAFVDFQDEATAMQAQRQLNGLRFLGKVLSVAKAINPTRDVKDVKNETEKISPLTPSLKETVRGGNSIKGSGLGQLPAGEPIAEKLGIDYPFPPHLEYAYPPPDGNILTNILNALIAVPRFYTQVLHLMNKMNIPAPFRMALPTPPLPAVVPSPPPPEIPPPPPPPPEKPDLASSLSDESEMESSEEEVDKGAIAGKKRKKREAIVGPAIDKDVAHEAVGLKHANLLPKEIPIIKKKNPVLQIKMAPKRIQSDETTVCTSEEQPENSGKELDIPYAAVDEIERHKLPPEELLSLPMFKNYTAGNPTNVLYIKNLAKDVVMDDIFYIFGSLFGSVGEARSGLNVRLMQEGRMRGQAFVTFPTVELAHDALNLANRYVFKGKPMVIQFGRSSSAKPS